MAPRTDGTSASRIWNSNPKPYVWTRTAEEILERLASYLNRIPDSGH
jgi:hypothetical protein